MVGRMPDSGIPEMAATGSPATPNPASTRRPSPERRQVRRLMRRQAKEKTEVSSVAPPSGGTERERLAVQVGRAEGPVLRMEGVPRGAGVETPPVAPEGKAGLGGGRRAQTPGVEPGKGTALLREGETRGRATVL